MMPMINGNDVAMIHHYAFDALDGERRAIIRSILTGFLNESFAIDSMIFAIRATFAEEPIITWFFIHEVRIILAYNWQHDFRIIVFR